MRLVIMLMLNSITILNYAQTIYLQEFGSQVSDQGILNISVGDLNLDGNKDIVAIGSNPGQITIHKGMGDGQFTYKETLSYAPLVNGFFGQLEDLNADNYPEIIVDKGAGEIAIFENDGQGNFTSTPTYILGAAALSGSFKFGDINNDMRQDLVIPSSDGIYVYLGSTARLDSIAYFTEGLQGYDLEIGDLNEDGFEDIVYSTFSGNSGIQVMYGSGTGEFTFAYEINLNFCKEVELADLNGNGHLDLITSTGNQFVVLEGNGQGDFISQEIFTTGKSIFSLDVGDLSLNGVPDVVLGYDINQEVDLYQTGSLMQMTLEQNFVLGNTVQRAIVSDFNNDDKPDLAIALYSTDSSRVMIYLNEAVTAQIINIRSTSLRVFPNPSPNSAQIDFDGSMTGHLTITDMTGKIRINKKIDNTAKHVIGESLEPGIYIVKWIASGQALNCKFIKY